MEKNIWLLINKKEKLNFQRQRKESENGYTYKIKKNNYILEGVRIP